MNILHSKTTNDAMDNLRQTSEAMMQSAEQAVDSTAEKAGEALHNRIDPMVDMMAVTAQKLAKQSIRCQGICATRHEPRFQGIDAICV